MSDWGSGGRRALEAEIGMRTAARFSVEDSALSAMLDFIERCLRLVPSPMPEDRQLALLVALVSRSFDSAVCAQSLWRCSYYQQAIMIIRHLDEDALYGHQLGKKTPEVLAALWDLRRPQMPLSKAAQDLGDIYQQNWREAYDTMSELAHTRWHALSVQLQGDPVRLGPVWDEDLARFTVAQLLACAGQIGVLAAVIAEATTGFTQEWVRRLDPVANTTYVALDHCQGPMIERARGSG